MAKGWGLVREETTQRTLRATYAKSRQKQRDDRRQTEVELGIRRCEVCGDFHHSIDFEFGDPHMDDGSYY